MSDQERRWQIGIWSGRRRPAAAVLVTFCGVLWAAGCDSTPPRSTPEIAAQWTLSEGGAVTIVVGGEAKYVPKLRGLPRGGYEVRGVHLVGVDGLEAEEFANLAGLESVRAVVLRDSNVGDEALWYLTSLKNLDRLDLSGAPITDDGLEHVGVCENLTSLSLAGTKVTGSGFDDLLGCRKLKTLDLARTPLRDEYVPTLAGLHNLDRLDLTGTGVSQAAVAELQAALKYCRIATTGD